MNVNTKTINKILSFWCVYSWWTAFSFLYQIFRKLHSITSFLKCLDILWVNVSVHPNLDFLGQTSIVNITKVKNHVLITCHEQGAGMGAAHALLGNWLLLFAEFTSQGMSKVSVKRPQGHSQILFPMEVNLMPKKKTSNVWDDSLQSQSFFIS